MSILRSDENSWFKKTIAKLRNNRLNKKLKYCDNKWDKKLRGKNKIKTG